MKINITVTYHLIPGRRLLSIRQEIASVEEVVKEQEPCYTAGGNLNGYSHYRKQYGGSSKH